MTTYFGEKENDTDYILREGVYAIIQNEKNEIALVETPRGYFLPGGGVKAKESHDQALKREISEELGYSIESSCPISKYGQFILGKSQDKHYELVGTFYCTKLGQNLHSKVEEDHEMIWFDIDEAVNRLQLPYQKHALKVFKTEEHCRMNTPCQYKEYEVVEPRKSEYPNPITVKKDERVECVEMSNPEGEWAGWVFCKSQNNEGWIPQQIISIDGIKGVLTQDYTAKEFDLNLGEVLLEKQELNGWIWCVKKGVNSECAWAPLNHLKEI